MRAADRNRECGKFLTWRRSAVAGLSRCGAGNRVRTDNNSTAACPDIPRRHGRSRSMDIRWNGFSRCTSASAALVSTSTCSALVGKPQFPHRVGVKFRSTTGKQEKTVGFDKFVRGDTLYPDGSAVDGDLHLPGGDAQLLAQRLRDHDASRLVNGSTHTMKLPFDLPSGRRQDWRWHAGECLSLDPPTIGCFPECRMRKVPSEPG